MFCRYQLNNYGIQCKFWFIKLEKLKSVIKSLVTVSWMFIFTSDSMKRSAIYCLIKVLHGIFGFHRSFSGVLCMTEITGKVNLFFPFMYCCLTLLFDEHTFFVSLMMSLCTSMPFQKWWHKSCIQSFLFISHLWVICLCKWRKWMKLI